MMRTALPSLAALAVCAFGSLAVAAPGEGDRPGMERMQVWASDHEAILNAGLAGLKAGLKLTTDQEKLWPPFETAVRDGAKLRMEFMKDRMERMRSMGMADSTQGDRDMKDMTSGDGEPSPVDRLEALAKRMSERGAAMMNVAEAAKPLYASLDDGQKRLFGLLGGELLDMGHGHTGMGPMGGEGMGMMGGGMGMMRGMGMMGDQGMGMMKGGRQGMGMMRNQSD